MHLIPVASCNLVFEGQVCNCFCKRRPAAVSNVPKFPEARSENRNYLLTFPSFVVFSSIAACLDLQGLVISPQHLSRASPLSKGPLLEVSLEAALKFSTYLRNRTVFCARELLFFCDFSNNGQCSRLASLTLQRQGMPSPTNHISGPKSGATHAVQKKVKAEEEHAGYSASELQVYQQKLN